MSLARTIVDALTDPEDRADSDPPYVPDPKPGWGRELVSGWSKGRPLRKFQQQLAMGGYPVNRYEYIEAKQQSQKLTVHLKPKSLYNVSVADILEDVLRLAEKAGIAFENNKIVPLGSRLTGSHYLVFLYLPKP